MRKCFTMMICVLLLMQSLTGCSNETQIITEPKEQEQIKEDKIEETNEIEEVVTETDNTSTTEPEIELLENEYLGVGDGGLGGTITVKVTVDNEKIIKIDVIEHHETVGIGTNAIDELIPIIITNNSSEVDSISGATMTSTALKAAVSDAVSKLN